MLPGKSATVTDGLRNRIYRTPSTQDVLGVVELLSNRQGSGIRGSEVESLKPSETQALAKVGHVTGDDRQSGTGPCGGPEPVRPQSIGQHWRTPQERGPRKAGTRGRRTQ